MLTGLPPFYCQDREKLFEKIRKAELLYPPSVSRPAKKVLVGLLTKDPTRRLGSGDSDALEIQKTEFFSSIDFDKLMRGELAAPWKPNISGSLDTSQFDKEFTKMPIFSPPNMVRGPAFGRTPDDNLFEGFTFTDRRFHGPGTEAGA
jgi:serine/threonine protein kinase